MADLSIRARGDTARTLRRMPFTGMELRALPDGTGGDSLRFTGYASVTEVPYSIEDFLGEYHETIKRGAFTRTLAEGADVPLKVNHDGITLARTKSGTMRLAEDSHGLHVEADLDARSPAVQTLSSAMERGDLDEMSFAFRVTRQDWSPDYTRRSIHEVDLNKGDVSIVNYGANPNTAGSTLQPSAVATAFRALRSGALTTDATETLMRVLQLVAAADGAVDVAMPLLADVLGVENPDLDAECNAVRLDHITRTARFGALDWES